MVRAHAMESFWILTVDSRYNVSLGGTLWKTTLEMDDFPLLYANSVYALV